MDRDKKAETDLLEMSPFGADRCELVGKHPKDVPSNILSDYYTTKNPLKAIRERCLDCCCSQPSEVRKCVAVDCPSWPFRIGVNPFRKKQQLSEEQKQRRAAQLRAGAEAKLTPRTSTSEVA